MHHMPLSFVALGAHVELFLDFVAVALRFRAKDGLAHAAHGFSLHCFNLSVGQRARVLLRVLHVLTQSFLAFFLQLNLPLLLNLYQDTFLLGFERA